MRGLGYTAGGVVISFPRGSPDEGTTNETRNKELSPHGRDQIKELNAYRVPRSDLEWRVERDVRAGMFSLSKSLPR